MALDQLMEKLAKEMAIEGTFATQLPGVFEIPVEETTSIYITASPNGVVLTSVIIDCPKEKRDLFFAHMLNANLYGEGTYGAVLGIDEQNHLFLSKCADDQIQFNQFRDLVEDFTNSVDFWREEAQSYLTR